ncbi:MAG: glycosyltransferase involved in cell wall biosynthesis [Pseudohongiellaceae bacterium]|jgi:glycosyltransferase involved in cell wall biosynthesis
MTKPRILVVIPVFNEELSIPLVLKELSGLDNIDVLVIDDASTDNSLKVAIAGNAKVLPLRVRLGAWGAMQAGLRYAVKHSYTSVITMDGDGQHHSHEIPKLLKSAFDNPKADVIIGECSERGSRMRKVAWSFFRNITGIGIEDITSGFRLYKKQAIHLLATKDATILDYQDIGVLLMLKSAGLRIVETKVSMTPRLNGRSHLFSSWLMVAYYMIVSTVLSISKFGKFSLKE